MAGRDDDDLDFDLEDNDLDSGGGSTLKSLLTLAIIVSLIFYVKGNINSGSSSDKDTHKPPPQPVCWLYDEPPCEEAFYQNDPRWANMKYGDGTMAQNGCAPAALAMIFTNLKGQRILPSETAAYATAQNQYYYDEEGNGEGSKHTIPKVLAPHWGLRAEKINPTEAEIKKALTDGGLVTLSGARALPFSKLGHYIVIRAVNPDGSVEIGNSAFKATNNRSWNLATEILPLNVKRETSV